MSYRRKAAIGLLVGTACLTGFLKIETDVVETWTNGTERIEFKYSSRTIYEAAYGMVMGLREITGRYEIRNGSKAANESGNFTLVTDEAGYVTGYALIASDGRQHRWTSGYCSFIQDDAGVDWVPQEQAPLRIYPGLITEITGAVAPHL